MRLLIVLLVFAPAVCAMDTDGVRFARRTLLHEKARKHLDCGVGDVEHLTDCTVLAGDFDGDGKADQAAAVRRDLRLVIAVFPASNDAAAPAGILALTETVVPAPAAQAMPGRDCVRLETKTTADETETLRWRLLRWDGAWVQALEFTRQVTRTSAQGRFRRETVTSIETGPRTELVTRSLDTLDGKELAGSATRTAAALTLKDGVYQAGPSAGEDTPVPTRVQLARTLEREGLLDIALEQAQAAVEKARRDKLADNDARLLDARTLCQRLEARLAAAGAVASR